MKKGSVLVCVTGQLSCERLIVAGVRAAQERGARTVVLHVARTGNRVLGYANEAEALEYLFQVSASHGADMTVIRSDDVVGVIEAQARTFDARVIVAGRAADYSGWDLLDELSGRMPDVEFNIL